MGNTAVSGIVCFLTLECFANLAEDTSASSSVEEYRPSDISQESEPKLRLRTKSTNETDLSERHKDKALRIKTSRPDVAVGYAVWLATMITILVLLCVGIWRWERSQSLRIPGSSL